jgi:DNA-binding protein HU-beta
MNKSQLIDAIASETLLTKIDSRKALESFVKTIVDSLKKGDRIPIIGFGTFSTIIRQERNGRNPQTGKTIKIAAKKVIRFKAGAELTRSVK